MTREQMEYFEILFGKETNVRGLQELDDRELKVI